MDKDLHFGDAYPPREIARKVEGLGVAKARTDSLTLLVLAVLAGAFISLGALFFIVVVTNSTLGFGMTRLVGSVSFCLGLILVVVAGAELFTGNNLIAMAWASKLIGTREVMRNWFLAYLGNVGGCLATVLLVVWANIAGLGGGFVAMGFEHSIANWFFLPLGLALDGEGAVSVVGATRNIVAVTAGNVVGGTLLVAGVYWVAYLRGERRPTDGPS